MALFGRKNEKEEEKIPVRGKGEKKGFTDRPPRKKKIELPTPWSKKERILVLSVLLTTVVIAGVLAASARSWKLPNLPRLSLPFFEFLKGGVVTLEGNGATSEDFAKADKVSSEFREVTRKLSGVYTFFVINLESGFSYGLGQDEILQAASLIKLPTMAGMYMEAEAGRLSLDEVYTLRNEDKVAGSGSLYGKPAGTKLTYRELIEYMGQESDNTAYRAVLNILGEERVKEIINEIGMVETSLDENETTPEDIGLFFRKLWGGNLISERNRDELLGYMTGTIYEEWLVAGIPENVRVAHKYGRELHVVNDAGIVFAQKPFVVVIMTKGVVESEADEIFPELTRIIYSAESSD